MLKKKLAQIIKEQCPYDDIIKNNGICEFYFEGKKSIGISFEDGEEGVYDEERYIYNLFYGDVYINICQSGTVKNPLPESVLTEITQEWNKLEMNKELECLFLKAVLLLRNVNRYTSKEEQLKEVREWYINGDLSKEDIEKWIQSLKNPEAECSNEDESENTVLCEDRYTPSSTARDYGPSNPWDAPGMSIRDFI